MKYVGIRSQQASNSFKSLLLLLLFPLIILGITYGILFVLELLSTPEGYRMDVSYVNYEFLNIAPIVIIGVGIWFVIAYYSNTFMINRAAGSRPLSRKENPRIYNIVENLCISCGMKMPKVNIVDDPQLNAFASGINDKTYTVTLTTGIINRLNDEELAGVIGHELTHIRNKDTQLLIVSIVFVGIMSMLMQLSWRYGRILMYTGGGRSRNNSKGNGVSAIVVIIVVVVFTALGYLFTLLTRFAISRKREYMADAGGAELCRNPRALASALRKISGDPGLQKVDRDDIAQLFIYHQPKNGFASGLSSIFSTHPDIVTRIRILEQF